MDKGTKYNKNVTEITLESPLKRTKAAVTRELSMSQKNSRLHNLPWNLFIVQMHYL
jgi:hypothetical protein